MKNMMAISVALGLALLSFLTGGLPGKAHAQMSTAPKSWCLGMKQQWQSRYDHFGRDDESIRASLEEHNCAYWGVGVP
jgi:hypothetical protein